jgi:hypothetical protein
LKEGGKVSKRKKEKVVVVRRERKENSNQEEELLLFFSHFSVDVKLRDLPGAVGRGPHLLSGLLVGGDEIDLMGGEFGGGG